MTTLKIVEMPKPEPLPRNEELINALKNLLSEAEEGRVIGACVCYLDHTYASVYVKGGIHSYATIGALHIMANQVARSFEQM